MRLCMVRRGTSLHVTYVGHASHTTPALSPDVSYSHVVNEPSGKIFPVPTLASKLRCVFVKVLSIYSVSGVGCLVVMSVRGKRLRIRFLGRRVKISALFTCVRGVHDLFRKWFEAAELQFRDVVVLHSAGSARMGKWMPLVVAPQDAARCGPSSHNR